mgnify:CR=1 FL=1
MVCPLPTQLAIKFLHWKFIYFVFINLGGIKRELAAAKKKVSPLSS